MQHWQVMERTIQECGNAIYRQTDLNGVKESIEDQHPTQCLLMIDSTTN